MRRVMVNKVRCKKCNDIIESKHNYDYQRCACGSIAIDGGTEYQRYSWGMNQNDDNSEPADFIDFSYSVYEDD